MDHITRFGLIGKQQFGFRKGFSAEDQLLEIHEEMLKSLDSQRVSKLVFLDASKAFDRVWRQGLKKKLNKLGFHESLINWLSDYLSGRLQRVVLKGTLSSWREVLQGVPQGSILGPLLYLLYSEDMKYLVENDLKMYADDSMVMTTGITEQHCVDQLQGDLDRIQQWSEDWKVKLNISKTKCLTVRRIEGPAAKLQMNGVLLEEVKSHRHLGVILMYNGKWTLQIDDMCKRAAKRVTVLRQYQKSFSRKCLKTIYLSYVRPLLEYSPCLITFLTVNEAERIRDIQRTAIRCITGTKVGTSHHPLNRELMLPTLSRRRMTSRMVKFWQIINRQYEGQINRNNLTTHDQLHDYHTRHPNHFVSVKCHTEQRRKAFLNTSISEWNKLEEEIKSSTSKRIMRSRLLPKANPNPVHSIAVTRESSRLISRLRCQNADLISNLFARGMSETPECECGALFETTKHYLLSCPRYIDLRQRMIAARRMLDG